MKNSTENNPNQTKYAKKGIKAGVALTAVLGTLAMGAGTAHAFGMTSLKLSDTNGDGVISADEIRAALEQGKAEILSQFDANGDGELSREERKAMKDARRATMIGSFDENGDGKLSRAERRNARDAREAALDLQLDVNGDGEVSNAESAGFDEVHAERKSKRGKRGERGEDAS